MDKEQKEKVVNNCKERFVNIENYFGIILFMTTACLGVYKINKSLLMNDAFWHIKTGEWIIKKGFPLSCYGSWSIPDKEWLAHEWLFGVLIYLVSNINYDAIVIFFEIIFCLVLLLCCKQGGIFQKNENPPTIYWLFVIVPQFAIYACMNTARPQYVSTIFVLLFTIGITRYEETKKKIYLYVLPVITVMWVNIHGGTAMLSYCMFGIYLAAKILGLFVGDIGKIQVSRAKRREWITFLVVMGGILLSILCNPYGYKMLLYPFENMRDKTMLAMISEWAAPDAKNMVCLIGEIIPILLGMVSLMQTDKKIEIYKIGLFLFYVLLYLRSERFISYLVIVQTCLITPYAFSVSFHKKQNRETKYKRIEKICNRILLQLILLGEIGGLFFLIASANYSTIEGNKELPDELIQMIKESNPQKLLNHYNVGGYLVYYDIPVFIDGRYEPYQKAGIVEDYLRITNPKDIKEAKQVDALLEKYMFDAYLLSTGNVELIEKIEERASVKRMYEDENWIYFADTD